MEGYLILENGEIFHGTLLGNIENQIINVVHHSVQRGMIELITNPNTLDQGIVLEVPSVYWRNMDQKNFQSEQVWASAIIAKEMIYDETTMQNFLEQNKMVILKNVDTEKLIQTIEKNGEMLGIITQKAISKDKICTNLKKMYQKKDLKEVTIGNIHVYGKSKKKNIALIDLGLKHGLVNELLKREIGVTIYPFNTTIEKIKIPKHDAILLSDGPEEVTIAEKRNLLNLILEMSKMQIPVLAIGQGYRLLLEAYGIREEKQKKGKRGTTYLTKDQKQQRLYVTTQNTKYRADPDAIANSQFTIRFEDLEDKQIVGVESENILAVAFDITPMPGTMDGLEILEEFIAKFE